MPSDLLTTARARALFAADMPAEPDPSSVDVAAAIRRAMRTHGGTRGCATVLAGEYGEHPETAAPRMRWALDVVRVVYQSTPVRSTVLRTAPLRIPSRSDIT